MLRAILETHLPYASRFPRFGSFAEHYFLGTSKDILLLYLRWVGFLYCAEEHCKICKDCGVHITIPSVLRTEVCRDLTLRKALKLMRVPYVTISRKRRGGKSFNRSTPTALPSLLRLCTPLCKTPAHYKAKL